MAIEDEFKDLDLHPKPNLKKVKAFFGEQHPDIEFVRFQWVDFTALVRTRLTTVRQAIKLASAEAEEKSGGTISVASPIANGFLVDGSFNEIHAGKKDDLVPDWSTLTPCYYHPGHASVMCFIDEPGQNFNTCPRTLLKNLEHATLRKHDMRFLVGTEIEFYLTESPGATVPVPDVGAYCSTASLRRQGSRYLAVLEDSVQAMERAGIPLWTFHTELVPGLFELQTEPLSPLRAADTVVYMHETIKTVAARHGLHATMHPKPFDKTHGVGQHMHISLSRQTERDDGFLAGVLRSVPALSAITMPNYDSYLRRGFAGGEWVCWDTENRLASVRKIRRAYWEFRFVDCTANNYLVLLALLGTGMAGWEAGEKGLALGMKPLDGREADALEDEGTRQQLGITRELPRDLADAVEALKRDEFVARVLGREVRDRFVRYKTREGRMLGEMTLSERRGLCVALF